MRKATILYLALAACLFASAVTAAEETAVPVPAFLSEGTGCAAEAAATVEAPAGAVFAQDVQGTCCVRAYVRCAAGCQCGVFEFNCTLQLGPTCNSNCVCNICPV